MAKLVYHDSTGAQGSIVIGLDPIVIGRATDCQIQTQDGLVSRRHARVSSDGNSFWVEDLGSANGVFIGTERIQRQLLRSGDVFRCGHLEVRLEVDAPRPGSRPPVPPVPPVPVAAPPPPPVAPPPPQAAPPPAAPSAELTSLRTELDGERRKRTDLEFELSELRRKLDEATAKLAQPAAAAPAADGDAERLRRRVEQLESELRRKGGGGGGGGGAEALRAAEAERDKLRARVAELEAAALAAPAAPAAPAVDEMEVIRMRRKIDQLESDLRRVRGGQPPSSTSADTRAAELRAAEQRSADLEDQVRKLTQERDEANRRAQVVAAPVAVPPAADPRVVEELERAKRQIEQLQSELRRKPGATVASAADGQRAQLEAALSQLRTAERERDALKEQVARGTSGIMARPPQKALDGLSAVSDGLADIRAAVRASGDDLALEQLEQLRATLRQAMGLLGIPN